MKQICNDCKYNEGWCNRLVVPGGFGRKDRTADDYASDNFCKYKKQGEATRLSEKPNFENS